MNNVPEPPATGVLLKLFRPPNPKTQQMGFEIIVSDQNDNEAVRRLRQLASEIRGLADPA